MMKRIKRSYERMTPKRKEPDLSTYPGRCGARLRALRERKGLTAEEIASALGVSYRAIYRWEGGESDPPFELLPQIAAILGLKSPRNVLAEK